MMDFPTRVRRGVTAIGLTLLVALPLFAQPVFPIPGYVEVGDMWLPESVVYGDGLFNATQWPNGVVPYSFDANVPSSNRVATRLAMDDLEAIADVQFVLRTSQPNYVRIYTGGDANSASSQVGMVGGQQLLRIGSNAGNKITLVHELLHTLGFLHEQSRPDRDNFVTINWQNISQTRCNGPCDGNFQIVNGGTTYGSYDFASIMHYSQYAFSICNDPMSTVTCAPASRTITCKPGFTQFQNTMGTMASMSAGDGSAVRARYGASTKIPLITGTQPSALVQGGGVQTLNVFGSGFYGGSLDGTGILGSQLSINGTILPAGSVTFVDADQITVTVPAAYSASAGCLAIRVTHAYGVSSSPWSLGVSAAGGLAGFFGASAPSSLSGYAVLGLGDVNGDRRDDVVVGSPGFAIGGQQYAGLVTCYSGIDGSILWSKSGGPRNTMGRSLADVGDVNGDGVKDILIGAPGNRNGTTSTFGVAFLCDGTSGTTLRTHTLAVVNDGFGSAVANAGDINGDGVFEYIIGVPGSNLARIYNGASGSLIRAVTGASGSEFGAAVGGGYDVNGDGTPDQVVGAPNQLSGRGRVHIYSGFSGGILTTRDGDTTSDQFGYAVAVMPSPNGAVGGAVVVGAPGNNSNRGFVRVYGPFAGGSVGIYPVIGTVNGLANGDRYGASVCAAGDLNQDGLMDVGVGAPRNSSGVTGYIHVLSGANLLVLEEATGVQNGDRFGWSMAPAGDTNADGSPDLIVGAVDASLGCAFSGYARLIYPVTPPEHRKFMLTEVYWGGRAGVEITNFATTTQSLQGWSVIWDDGTWVQSAAIGNVSLPSGRSFILHENAIILCPITGCTASNVYSEAPANTPYAGLLPSISTGGQPFTVGLVNPNGLVVDEVRITGTGLISQLVLGSVGGAFRGLAVRTASTVSLERIWGLDSNSGQDWTAETARSMGRENRSSGPRGTDPIPTAQVVINEIDADPADYVELRNLSSFFVNLRNWKILGSSNQDAVHGVIRPWHHTDLVLGSASQIIGPSLFAVVGDGPVPPPEKPAVVPYVDLSAAPVGGGGNLPWLTEEYDCALYDAYGRLVDLVRVTGQDDVLAHNEPRAPSHWTDFTGVAPRSIYGDGSVGRLSGSPDNNSGADWRPLFVRSMGSANSTSHYGGLPGLGDPLDVRLNGGLSGGGLACIINAGPSMAGSSWTVFFSFGHQNGVGPFFGLGADALNNWLAFGQGPPFAGTLDARGSTRLDVDPGTFASGLTSDDIFLVIDPSGTVLRTPVVQWN